MPVNRPKGRRFYRYSFYFAGERYRGSTKKTTRTAAAAFEARLLAQLQEGQPINLSRKRPPTLGEFAVRFLEWVKNFQQLTPNSTRYYRYGWRLLSLSKLAGMRLDHISQDVPESTKFKRPLLNRKKKTKEESYEETKEMIACTGHYINQALRTLKRMQSKAVEWKVLREIPKIRLAYAQGRDRLIDEETEDGLEQAYHEPIKHRRTRRLREQAWLVMVIMQDSGMRPVKSFHAD